MGELLWVLWMGLLAIVIRMERKHLSMDRACGHIDTARMSAEAAGPLLGEQPRDELKEFGRGSRLRLAWVACAGWLAVMLVIGKDGFGS